MYLGGKLIPRGKIEISKTPDGYFRVFENDGKVARPLSPKEFLNKADARNWIRENIGD